MKNKKIKIVTPAFDEIKKIRTEKTTTKIKL